MIELLKEQLSWQSIAILYPVVMLGLGFFCFITILALGVYRRKR